MITLKQIQYALAVAKTGQIRKAADYCAVSQSALSAALSEMETRLGFALFERNNKQLLTTPRGKQALELAAQIRLLLDDLEKLGHDPGSPLDTSLSLGIIPTICPFLLPRVMPTLQQAHPALQLQISEAQSRVLVDQVRSGDLDAAIIALPYECDGLLTFSFWQEDLYWVTNADDPLTSKRRLDSSEMDPQRLMLLKDGHCLKDHALLACNRAGIPDEQLSATSLITLVQLAASGMGVTLVPEMALPQLVSGNPAVKAIALATPGPHREIAFVLRPNYPGLNGIEMLMALFRQALSTNS